MATFFTADTHFGHAGARGLYRRPFPTVAAMDAAMEERWNGAVAPEDTVYHLGDFALGHAAPGPLLARLHGHKHLLTGNNDGSGVTGLAGWASVAAYLEVTVDGTALVLCHYAFRTWRDMGAGGGRGALNLHGHSHGRLGRQARQIDVGVDVWDFRPVTLGTMRLGRPAAPS